MNNKNSMRSFIFLLLSIIPSLGKLQIDDLDELYKDGAVDWERIKAEADHIDSRTQQTELCPGVTVEERVDVYDIMFKQENGEYESEELDVKTILDQRDGPRIHNALEPWIFMDLVIRPYLNCLKADDPKVLNHLKKKILTPPSDLPYNWTAKNPRLSGQFGQPTFLDMVIFKGQVKDGFFIEAGADDFESDSNTILFELEHNWSGILVEPNPTIYPLGLMKHRKAWGAGTCLGLGGIPSMAQFSPKAVEGGMAGIVPEATSESMEMQCFPLYSLILATGNRTINYFSLDIEGAELQVLESIPWDKVDIEVITIESNHMGEVFPGSQSELYKLLEDQNYVYAYTVAIDDVFIRRDLYEGKYAPDPELIKKYENKYGQTCIWDEDNQKVQFYRLVTEALRNQVLAGLALEKQMLI